DEEVRKIVDESHGRAREILTTHRAKMDRLVAALLERETLGREEFLAVMEDRELPASTSYDSTPPANPNAPVVPTGDSDGGFKAPASPPRLEPGPA
ncbi:MAG: hypothetical protein SFX74_12665, partial [Fimbriimonadaceae bacterium]|nr:hypothetical protein [Fimbriimonadaceae bacterium]